MLKMVGPGNSENFHVWQIFCRTTLSRGIGLTEWFKFKVLSGLSFGRAVHVCLDEPNHYLQFCVEHMTNDLLRIRLTNFKPSSTFKHDIPNISKLWFEK
jgi:hypothetical protein